MLNIYEKWDQDSSNMTTEFTNFQKMQNLCLAELSQLQKNLENTVEATNVLLNSFTENKYNYNEYSEESLSVYDKCITTLTDIMNASRKANVTFKLKLSEVRGFIRYYYKRDMHCREEKMIDSKIKAIELPSFEIIKHNGVNNETKPIANNKESFNLYIDKSIYTEGTIITGHVSHIENVEDLIFYIVDSNSVSVRLLKELSEDKSLIRYNTLPPDNVIFGLVLDNLIVRAVFTKFVSLNSKSALKCRKALLLDYGDKIDVTATSIIYQLKEKYKALPSQAILSKLCTDTTNNINMQKKLENLISTTVNFRVKCIENDILYLYFCDSTTNTNRTVATTNGLVTNFENMQLTNSKVTNNGWVTHTKENNDMRSYFEEPTTTNALKAIMGYIPKDDIKLCEFYDPKTGECFKGKNCTKEHKPKPIAGSTKDMHVTSNVLSYNEVRFPKNSLMCVQPTHITRLDQMYCSIVTHKPTESHIWNDRDNLRPLQKLPHLHDMVLARYYDGLWYRGKVVDEDANEGFVKVFYVDYGNTETVSLKDLSFCDISIARMPYRAILCKVANVSDITEMEEDRNEGLHLLREKILNEKLDVEVVVHYEDLIINFLDDEIKKLFETFKKLNYVKDCV